MIGVYADLYTLLDFEIGVAKTLDPNAIERWGTKWAKRVHNHHPDQQAGVGYTYRQWKDAFDNMDESILEHVIPTRLLWQHPYVVADFVRQRDFGAIKTEIKLTVNTYPFTFEGEALQGLREGIRQFQADTDELVIINTPPENIDVATIKKLYKVVFLYDFGRWLKFNALDLEQTPLSTVLMVARRICLEEPPVDTDLEVMFENIEKSSSMLMFMRMFKMHWFSYFIPPRKPQP